MILHLCMQITYSPVYVHVYTTDGINTTISLTKCFSDASTLQMHFQYGFRLYLLTHKSYY